MVRINNMVAVSVVIPSVRGGQYLRESIASVQAQTLEDWELIIVLDGCKDDLVGIVENDQRVRVFQQSQRGASIARNVGVRRAQSELIAFLDDDDRMLPDRLLSQYEAMSDEGVGICHTQIRYIDENGMPIASGHSRKSQYRDFLRGDGAISLSSTMIRKALIQEVGGFNSLFTIGEDLDLIYRVARESTVNFLPVVLSEYRKHATNTWLGKSLRGSEMKLILGQHLLAAHDHEEADDLKAARIGMAVVLKGRAQLAMLRARELRSQRSYIRLVGALALAICISPLAAPRVLLRAIRREGFGG
jgi:alpha-1,3-rhamnosyltransferase